MCFSAQASFIASALLSCIGLISFAAARSRQQKLLACTPLLFGMQQACEGLVWIMLPSVTFLASVPTYLYLLFAYCFWPVWIPALIAYQETDFFRKLAIYATLAVGAVLSLFFLQSLIFYGAYAQIAHKHIVYTLNESISFFMNVFLSVLYLLATVVPFLITRNRLLWLIGALLAIAYLVSFVFYYHAIGSVWCFFGAIISSLIILIIYRDNRS